jgi:hypothetical protein
MHALKLVAVGTSEHPAVDVTRAVVEAIMALAREIGYEGQLVGSRATPEVTIRFYACDANIGGYAVLEQDGPFPYWRLAEKMTGGLDAPIQIVTLQIAAGGACMIRTERVSPDGSRDIIDEESYDGDSVTSIDAAEERLVAALDFVDDKLSRVTWGYFASKATKKRR